MVFQIPSILFSLARNNFSGGVQDLGEKQTEASYIREVKQKF